MPNELRQPITQDGYHTSVLDTDAPVQPEKHPPGWNRTGGPVGHLTGRRNSSLTLILPARVAINHRFVARVDDNLVTGGRDAPDRRPYGASSAIVEQWLAHFYALLELNL